MTLPHCAFQSDEDVSSLLKSLGVRPEQEVDVAASKSFINCPPNWAEICAAWERHYRQSQAAATSLLGVPEFDGRWNDPGFPGEEVLPEDLSAHLLTVWRQGSEAIYLRFGHEDKGLPFVIAFGTKQSRANLYLYPGQFGEDPVEASSLPKAAPTRTAFVTLVGDSVHFDAGEHSLDDFIAEIMNRQEDFDAIELSVQLIDSKTMIQVTQRLHSLPFQVTILMAPHTPKSARVATVFVFQDRARFGDSDLSVGELIETLRVRAGQFDEVVIFLFTSPSQDPRPTLTAGLNDTGLEVIYVLPPGRE